MPNQRQMSVESKVKMDETSADRRCFLHPDGGPVGTEVVPVAADRTRRPNGRLGSRSVTEKFQDPLQERGRVEREIAPAGLAAAAGAAQMAMQAPREPGYGRPPPIGLC